MFFQECLQFLLGQARVFFHHKHFHRFARVVVGDTDHGAFEHFRMHHGDVFHFIGIDIEAGDQHHVLFAVDDFHEALLVHDADVAGAEKAVGSHDFGGFVRALPVAGHHLRAANGDFTR